MLFKRFYDDGLAQASYMIGCEATSEAIVVDANRDIAQYVEAAAREKMRITHVTETHIHADYVSGSRELAKVTGAELLLSASGGPDWQYAFATSDHATLLHDGDTIDIGNVRLDAMHTPGHTPEHLCFLVTDRATRDLPVGILSGDFVFVGDVGRPDLLERAAHVSNTMEASARDLFQSLQRFRELPDYVQVWPGHGAGSACGKALGSMPQSTVGYEKITNWGVASTSEADFVREVLAGQPEPPTYFAEMKRINREGPPILGSMRAPKSLPGVDLSPLIARGAPLVDIRAATNFAAGHVPGTLNIPFGKSFSTWAGWLLPYTREIFLIADDAASATQAAREMAMIGLDHVAGWLAAAEVAPWERERSEQISAADLATRLAGAEVTLVDVRNRSEWDHGHIDGAIHIPVGHLGARLAEVPRDLPIVVQCQGGLRSAIASSVLLALGVVDVLNLTGGYTEWVDAGLPVTTD
jgi:hydroxyacylglutathione hydrolase